VFSALLGFNTFWTFSAGNQLMGGIHAPKNTLRQIHTSSNNFGEFSAGPNKQLDQSDSPSNAFY
jgi:hypothetical protein